MQNMLGIIITHNKNPTSGKGRPAPILTLDASLFDSHVYNIVIQNGTPGEVIQFNYINMISLCVGFYTLIGCKSVNNGTNIHG